MFLVRIWRCIKSELEMGLNINDDFKDNVEATKDMGYAMELFCFIELFYANAQ